MPVKFFNEDSHYNLQQKRLIKEWIKTTIHNENAKLGTVNFIFTSDNYLLQINKEYLSHNYYTDIITFNYCENTTVNGDIFISLDTIRNNSTRFGVTFINELHRVMIHGILHLIGYDDGTDEEKVLMREKENYYLERLENLF